MRAAALFGQDKQGKPRGQSVHLLRKTRNIPCQNGRAHAYFHFPFEIAGISRYNKK
ncbi:hypothetical protein [Heyndrickxia coagulans]|uniref:hypothetical protein n=1 Tax=Heyndrickxia coagulans TaxID=1398 RepID=UPI0002E0D71E|nr:hypothetical protein [Heyndrickxia coagulans]